MTIDPRIIETFEQRSRFALEPHVLVLALMGSHSHGTYLPPEDPSSIDDVDLMGFVVPPLEYHLGLPRWQHTVFQREELDVVLYGLDKAFRLLLKGNPNIVGLLWLRDEEYVHRTELFDELRRSRSLFASQTAATSFSGYAHAQLQKMEAFSLDRMEEYERLRDRLSEQLDLEDLLQADAPRLRHFESLGISRDWMTRFRKLHRQHFSGYMGEKRKAMVRRYGYDVKNASHLIRLLRMGAEFMATGELQVYRTADAEELMAIKRGEWTLEQVKTEAERLFAEFDAARDRSPLPEEPDAEHANALLMNLQRAALGIA